MVLSFAYLEYLFLRWSGYGDATECWVLESLLSDMLLLELKLGIQCCNLRL